MSVSEIIEKLSTAGSAPAAAPVTAPVTTEEPKEPVIPPAEEPKPDTVAEQPSEVPAEEPIEETEPNLEEQPETSGDFAKYKPLFKEHPELRQIVGREKAFSELGDFSTVREVMSRVPTIEDAEVLVNDAENKRELGRTFREDRNTFVESLKESDPLAFQQFTKELPEILAQTDEGLWREQATAYTSTVLSNAYQIAGNAKDEELAKAVQLLSTALGMPLGAARAAQPTSSPELEKLRREKAEREQNDAQAAFDSFWSQTDEVVITSTVGEIENSIKKAVPQATPAQLKRMVNEAYDRTLDNLKTQPQFVSQMSTYRANAEKGRMGIADHKQIVDFSLRRAKLVIPKAVKETVNEWSSTVLKTNNENIEKKQAIAKTTKDVGAGPQGTSSVAGGQQKQQSRHLKDIFAELDSRIRGTA